MSAPDSSASSLFDWAMGAFVFLFVFGMGSGIVYGFWSWLLAPAVPCFK